MLIAEQPKAGHTLPNVKDWTGSEKLTGEKEMLGFYITGHPLDQYMDKVRELCTHSTGQLEGLAKNTDVALCGILTGIARRRSKEGKLWASMQIEDLEGAVEAMVFSTQYERLLPALNEDKAVLVRGLVLPEENAPPKISVQDIVPLEVARVRLALAHFDQGSHEWFRRRRPRREAAPAFRRQAWRDRGAVAPGKVEGFLGYPGCDGESSSGQGILRRDCPHLRVRSAGDPGRLIRRRQRMSDFATPQSSNPSWERVQLARHPKRPHALDYIQRLFTDFHELHGDRAFGDDHAIVAGMARFDGKPVMVVAQQKGRDTKQKVFRNFGCPRPEGYRKAMRLMELAAKFTRPIITFLDTQGACPGSDAEERGQGEAIASSLREMSRLGVPVVAVVIGEGGSGGALALGVGNRIYMLENAVYSVISPESCAAIIYRDSGKAPQAAAALKMTAPDLLELGLIDAIIPEPGEGAHTDPDNAAEALGNMLRHALAELKNFTLRQLIDQRYDKFRHMGSFFTEQAAAQGSKS